MRLRYVLAALALFSSSAWYADQQGYDIDPRGLLPVETVCSISEFELHVERAATYPWIPLPARTLIFQKDKKHIVTPADEPWPVPLASMSEVVILKHNLIVVLEPGFTDVLEFSFMNPEPRCNDAFRSFFGDNPILAGRIF